jgi:hypothetical protein
MFRRRAAFHHSVDAELPLWPIVRPSDVSPLKSIRSATPLRGGGLSSGEIPSHAAAFAEKALRCDTGDGMNDGGGCGP